MNFLLHFFRNTFWLVLRFGIAVIITVLAMSLLPILIIAVLGIISLLLAIVLAILFTINGDGPALGFVAGMLLIIGVVVATILIIAFLLLFLIAMVTLTALPISLVTELALRRKENKSGLAYFVTYSLSGSFAGLTLSALALATAWESLSNFHYAGLAISAITISSILFGMLSVNICGFSLQSTHKVEVLVHKWLLARRTATSSIASMP